MYHSTAAIYLPSCQVPHTTPRYHTYLRRAVLTAKGACAGEMVSPFHVKAIAAVAAAQQHQCCCCCEETQPQHQQQHYRSSSSSSIAAGNMSAGSIRPNYCEYRTRFGYCTSIRALSIPGMKNSIMTTGSNRSVFNPRCCEHEQYRTPDT